MSKEMELIAEIEVRRFFDIFLNEVFPQQLEAVVTAHNRDVTAHAPQIKAAIKAESSRIKLWVYGLIFAAGAGGGVGVAKAFGFLVGS